MLKFNVFKYGMRCSMAVKWVALKSDCLGLKLDSGHVLTVTLVKTLNLSVPQFYHLSDQIRSDQSLSRVRLLTTPWIEACQASLSITNSRSSFRQTYLISIKRWLPPANTLMSICSVPNDLYNSNLFSSLQPSYSLNTEIGLCHRHDLSPGSFMWSPEPSRGGPSSSFQFVFK